ncbi:unnamed protein product [Allacma fusca]|uniref:Uncharacterized protein n=1 Tax=Allacma fusca TaxID=39272 RepID=A0A8J2KYZ7_9HEXA|nr:unnamed protein product [Allacma fusca]
MGTSTKRKAMEDNEDKAHPSAPFKLHKPEVMSQTSAEINQAQPNTSTMVTMDLNQLAILIKSNSIEVKNFSADLKDEIKGIKGEIKRVESNLSILFETKF